MELSARNQIPGRIRAIQIGNVMAEIAIDIGAGNTLVSVITRASVERLGLKENDQVTAIIKSTEIMIGK